MANSTQNRFPTWMIVVTILVLAGPIIWALSMFKHIIAAMSIGGILVVIAIVVLLVWLKNHVDD